MAEALPFAPLQHLQRLLGLPAWHLRRDMAEKPAVVAEPVPPHEAAAKTPIEPPPLPVKSEPAVVAHVSAEAPAVATVLTVEGHRIRVCRDLTVLEIENGGSWWLPALSRVDGKMRLFRSDAEMAMLRTLLEAVGLQALAAHLQNIDAFLATRQMPANRLPANAADLLSLPAPWLLCGAIAQKQAESVAAAQERLPLPHPLALLKTPRQKRVAWQQILAYKQKIHD